MHSNSTVSAIVAVGTVLGVQQILYGQTMHYDVS
jgi:hypothetical protein